MKRFLEQDTTYQIYNDPAINLGIDLITKLFEMNMQVQQASGEIERNERLFNSAVRRMYASRNFYPDANSTMRLSFGTVCGYAPSTERNMIIIPPRKVFWRKSEPMQAMWI